ncbi:hypothetical protein M422DRAFT_191802 [Sphaerobolus stellatus SS14]|uniref:Uncharacterized protein n=1 Tax=Sphaerobolus stellatus (strain SS14) TaxID=990650 RepID=A0A0C9UMQ4_SPHS4|nr:hypothetical protein M422DRAFT_191802 [Sphaerobolus stellatus SS14]
MPKKSKAQLQRERRASGRPGTHCKPQKASRFLLRHLRQLLKATIYRYANRSAKFMDAYMKGLNGTQAAWAAQKYHGHRVLPGNIFKELEEAQNKTP